MLSKSRSALLFAVIAAVAAAALLYGREGERAAAGRIDESTATTANFQLAEKFSDTAIYRALYGPSDESASSSESTQSNGTYIKFHTVLVQPNWIEGSSDFWYAVRVNGANHYYIVSSEGKRKEVLFDAKRLSQLVERETGLSINLSESVPESLRVANGGDLIEFNIGRKVVQFQRSMGILSEKPAPRHTGDNFVPPTHEFSRSPDGRYIVFSMDNDLYVRAGNGPPHRLTHDGERWYGYSQQEGSYDSQKPLQHRMGWFGDSGKFFVERWDNRKVGEMWFIDSLTEPRPTLRTTRFAMPGEQHIPIQELWIFDAGERTGFRVDVDKWPGQIIGDMDITARGFKTSQDDKHVYFARMSRGFHEIELLKVNAATGDVRVLMSEKSEPYFTIRFPTFSILSKSGEFIWASDRSGRNHYYLYDENGEMKLPITGGDYTASRIAYLDEVNRSMVIGAFGKDSSAYPFHRQYYKVSLDGGDPLQLTPEDATHEAYFSPDGRFFVDNYSRADQAPSAVLRDTNGTLIMHLEDLDTKGLSSMGFRFPEYFTAKAADGKTDLFGVMWLPANFDPSRSYPVIAAVQPNAGMSGADFGKFRPGNVAVQIAQLGFVVVEFRTRGQGRHVRDKEYILHSYGNERDFPLADAKGILEQLTARHEYLDANRVGVYGHSGGGFMAASLCMTYPSLFKACVSSSGNHDNRIYEQNSTEYHWGVRQTVAEGAGPDAVNWQVNLHPNQELADGLDSNLLLVHGDNDTDVHFSQSVRLADALIKANKRFDFMIVPSRDHEYDDYNAYFDRLRWAYFAEHLLGDQRNLTDLTQPKADVQ